ncbi:MAG TPA: NAD(P)-binding domain-containing protein [Longimicrobiaceae bacterium]|nr:NAD(P)-binding domain-containing protein [Longimicrobiaceae bacterium]
MRPTERDPHVAILGAGPAGLAAAAALLRRGISCAVLERGSAPADALRRVDPEMEMLSPTRLSLLRGMDRLPGDPPYLTFRELVAKLERYVALRRIPVRTGYEVTVVRREGGRFRVRWRTPAGEEGETVATHVVNATGIITSPWLPESFAPERFGSRWMHSLDVRSGDLAGVRRLLVVGGGASAAEVLERWLELREPDARAWLALRSRLRATPHWVLGVDVHYLGWLPERLPAHLLGRRAARLPEPMLSREVPRAIRRGVIEKVPATAGFVDGGVTLEGGRLLEPELVVFATGYRYDTAHLGELVARDPDGRPVVHACRSTRAPGVWLLGTRFARTFASPYVRGIARDAEYVARRIAREA